MDSLNACHITEFDDLLSMSNDSDEFKKGLAAGQFDSNVTDKLFICLRLIKKNLREDLFTVVTTEKVTEEVRQFNSNETRHQATTTEIITRNNAVALNKSLKDMLESSEVGDSVRKSLRGEISNFLERANSHCDRLDNHVADLNKTFIDLSTNETPDSLKSINGVLCGFRLLLNYLGDTLGISRISRKKPSSHLLIDEPSVNADKLIDILNDINSPPEKKN